MFPSSCFFDSAIYIYNFSLCISLWEISIDISSSSLTLSCDVSSLLMSSSKALFLSFTVFLFLVFLFDSFLAFPSFCLRYPSFLHVVHFFHYSPSHISQKIFKFSVWSFQHLCHTSSGAVSYAVSSNCIFLFFILLFNFLLKFLHDILGKRIWGKWVASVRFYVYLSRS